MYSSCWTDPVIIERFSKSGGCFLHSELWLWCFQHGSFCPHNQQYFFSYGTVLKILGKIICIHKRKLFSETSSQFLRWTIAHPNFMFFKPNYWYQKSISSMVCFEIQLETPQTLLCCSGAKHRGQKTHQRKHGRDHKVLISPIRVSALREFLAI